MSQTADNSMLVSPLPGLAKLFLVYVYPLAVSLICARFVFTALGASGKNLEPLFWSMLLLIVGFALVISIVGLHSRSSWAPRVTAASNLTVCLLCIVACIRAIFALTDMHYIGRSEFPLMVIAATIAMNIPIFYAWFRYFYSSNKISKTFDSLATQNHRPLPGPGIGILQTISWAYLFFHITFFICIFLALKDNEEYNGCIHYTILWQSPFIVFPLLFLLLSRYKSKTLKHLAIAIIAAACTLSVWMYFVYIIQSYSIGSINYAIYSIGSILNLVPLPSQLMTFILVLLAWIIWSSPQEHSWLQEAPSKPRFLVPFCVYSAIFIYFGLDFLCSKLFPLLGARDALEEKPVFKVLLFLLLAAASAATVLNAANILNKTTKRWNEKRLSFLAFGSIALAIALNIAFILCLQIMDNESGSQLSILAYKLSLIITPLPVGVLAIVHWYKTYVSKNADKSVFFQMPAMFLAFAALSLMILVKECSATISSIIIHNIDAMPDYLYGVAPPINLANILLRVEFIAAIVICPLLALKWLPTCLEKTGRFYALCTIWICAHLSTYSNDIIFTLADGYGYDVSYSLTSLFSSTKQFFLYAIVFFMIYLSVIKKNVNRGITEVA